MHTILYCHHYNQISGGETSLLELFANLDRSRFRPVLAAPAEGPFPEAVRGLGIDVVPTDYASLRRLGRLAACAMRLRRIIRESGARLIHANGPLTNIPAALAGRTAGVPVVWHARTMPMPGEVDLDRCLLPMASLLIANSEAIRGRFGRNSPKCITILNGVDVERFHPSRSGAEVRARLGIEPTQLLIGVVGRISPIKGQRTFAEAAALLTETHPDVRFILVGAGLFSGEQEHEKDMRAFVKDRGLEDRIFFSGYQRDVVSHAAALDICTVPSDMEGCSRVVFEAMALGKPVVGTNTGGTPEMILDGETGFLIPPREPRALAEALGKLIADTTLRTRMGAAGRKRVEENFTIGAHIRKTEAAYARLLEGGHGHG